MRGLAGERGVDPLDADRAVPAEAELAQRTEDGVGGTVAHVELDGIPIWPTRGPGSHHDVLHPGEGSEPVGKRPGENGRADEADVQHHEPPAAGPGRTMV